MTRVYFDTEFEGLRKDAKLISMGLVTDDGKELYLEFNDIDIDKQDEWIKENVLANTVYYGNADLSTITDEENYHCGSKEELQGVLRNWFRQFPTVQMVSDVSHYDFVQFIDIFGTAFDLPKNVNASCHDINQDIASYYFILEDDAFKLERELILDQNGIVVEGVKHNSLYDAKVIKEIHKLVCGNG